MSDDLVPYQRVFLNDYGGRVLTDLKRLFHDRDIFVEGGHEGDRLTAYKAGQQSVIRYILKRLETK